MQAKIGELTLENDCHPSGALACNRRQSTPAVSQRHSASLKVQIDSLLCGQVKRPRCNRRTHNQTPVPSQISSLILLPARLRKA